MNFQSRKSNHTSIMLLWLLFTSADYRDKNKGQRICNTYCHAVILSNIKVRDQSDIKYHIFMIIEFLLHLRKILGSF